MHAQFVAPAQRGLGTILLFTLPLAACNNVVSGPSEARLPDIEKPAPGVDKPGLPDFGDDPQLNLGLTLYETNCAGCHGTMEISTKKNRSAEQIRAAFTGIPSMATVGTRVTDAEVDAISAALIAAAPNTGFDPPIDITDLPSCEAQADPGRVTVHKLNNTEYNNSVRTLLDLPNSYTPGAALPRDGVGLSNFNNDAQALSITAAGFRKYLDAAESAVAYAFDSGAQSATCEAEVMRNLLAADSEDFAAWEQGSATVLKIDTESDPKGSLTAEHLTMPSAAGTYLRLQQGAYAVDQTVTFSVFARAKTGNQLVLRITGTEGPESTTFALGNDWRRLYVTQKTTGGSVMVSLENSNGIDHEVDAAIWGAQFEVGNLTDYIQSNGSNPATPLARVCVISRLEEFAAAAFRRPITNDERARLGNVVDSALAEGQELTAALQLGMQWVLIAPAFLYRTVAHPNPDAISHVTTLNPFELASRLSYFLWSAPPDAALLEQAADGSLANDASLIAAVDRMLRDPRARSLTDNFALRWLHFDKLDASTPDSGLFPSFSMALRADMQTETQLLLDEVLTGDESIMRLLDADHTYLNQRLSEHYGFGNVVGNDRWERVPLPAERFGLVTHASVMTLTSNPDRTSLVQRGQWVLENLLCQAPPPPPANVDPNLDPDFDGTLRERIEAHRADAACISCHETMDNIGFGLEHFDAVGRWRETYSDGAAIDDTGVLPDGRRFQGAADLAQVLERDPYYRICFTEKLLSYALGRTLNSADQCTVNRMARDATGDSKSFSDLVKAVVTSDPFRKQRGGL